MIAGFFVVTFTCLHHTHTASVTSPLVRLASKKAKKNILQYCPAFL